MVDTIQVVAKPFLALFFICVSVTHADAAVTTETFTFTASDFVNMGNAGYRQYSPPYPDVTGTVTITADFTQTNLSAEPVDSFSLSIPEDYPLYYTANYDAASGGVDVAVFSAVYYPFVDYGGALPGTDSIYFVFDDVASAALGFGGMGYATSSLPSSGPPLNDGPVFSAFEGTVSEVSSVPEPSTLMLAVVGLVGLAGYKWCKDQQKGRYLTLPFLP